MFEITTYEIHPGEVWDGMDSYFVAKAIRRFNNELLIRPDFVARYLECDMHPAPALTITVDTKPLRLVAWGNDKLAELLAEARIIPKGYVGKTIGYLRYNCLGEFESIPEPSSADLQILEVSNKRWAKHSEALHISRQSIVRPEPGVPTDIPFPSGCYGYEKAMQFIRRKWEDVEKDTGIKIISDKYKRRK